MVAYLTDASCWIQWKRNERLCELGVSEYLLNPCTQLDVQLHPGLDPEGGSSIDGEYSVTCVAPVMAWYSVCVMWSRGGASGMSDGGRLKWVVGWVVTRGFFGIYS